VKKTILQLLLQKLRPTALSLFYFFFDAGALFPNDRI
jgi:hypothetical protein